MNEKEEKEINLDLLRHIEDLSDKINKTVTPRTQAVLSKYPITFGLLILFGAIAVHEGVRGLMKNFGFLDLSPWYLLIAGLVILAITGTLYKKLEK